jgi:hypothetical protein
MHSTLFATLALATFTSAPLHAQTAGTTTKPVSVTSEADLRVDTALETCKKKILAGDKDRAAATEYAAAINAAYTDLASWTPSTDTIRKRLINAMNDIYTRAAKAQIKAEEFELQRIDAIDARLENAISKAAADPTIDNLTRITNHLTKLADAAKALVPATVDFQARAQALIDALVKKARYVARDLEPLKSEVSASRAERSETLLENRAVAKTYVDNDFLRTKSHYSEHLDWLAKTDPSVADLKAKLLAILDSLQTRAAGAGLTREEFNDLKAQFIARARAAAAPK